MKMLSILLSFFFLLAADSAKEDQDHLQGEWSMVSAEIDGHPMPESMVKTGTRACKENEVTVNINGQVFMKAKFALDPSKEPKWIDYAFTGGPTAGKKQLGIYKFEGHTLTFCFSSPEKDRPTEFATTADSGRTLSVWKRKEK